MGFISPRAWVPHLTRLRGPVRLPDVTIPPGEMVELPGRGRLYLTDVPGPPGAPTLVLLHALACTGMLTWFPAVEELSRHFRLLVPDQRWHGRGITSDRFRLRDCADDVAVLLDAKDVDRAIIGGYSMGSIVAQRVWRQHPERVDGLLLCATTDRFRNTIGERVFHQGLQTSMWALGGLSRFSTVRYAARAAADAAEGIGTGLGMDEATFDLGEWAMKEFRSTSPLAVAAAVADIGRHHSIPWLPGVDVPTSVVLTTRDWVLPPSRQRRLAEAIPTAHVHEVEMGHAGLVFAADRFVPTVTGAALDVAERAGLTTVRARRASRPARP